VLEDALDRHPGEPDLLAELGLVAARRAGQATTPEQRQRHLSRAAEALRAAVRAAPYRATLHRRLGTVMLDRGEVDAAIAALGDAAALHPQSIEGQLLLGRAWLEADAPAPAAHAFRAALALDAAAAHRLLARLAAAAPGDWRAQRDLAFLLAIVGDAAAGAAAERALAGAPAGRRDELSRTLGAADGPRGGDPEAP
jgi:hypothetical protein